MKRRVMVVAAAGSLLAACGGMDGDGDSDPETRTIDGALTSEVTGEGETGDQIVVASSVDAQGNVEALPNGQSATMDDGRYSIEVTEEIDTDTTLLIQAVEGDDILGSVVFNVDDDPNSNVAAPPITIDSSAEAQVTVQARAQEDGCAFCINGDLERRIDDNVAAMIQASAVDDPAVYSESAIAVFAGVQARNEMLISEAVGGSEDDLSQARNDTAMAYNELQHDLIAASSVAERDAAHRDYVAAYLNAFDNAGFTPSQLAVAAHAETSMMVAYGTPSSPMVAEALRAETETLRAHYVTQTMELRFADAGLDTDAVARAGEILRNEIDEAAANDTGVEAAVIDAWDAYRTDVNIALGDQSDATVESLVEVLDTSVDDAATAYSSELAQIDETASPRDEASVVVTALTELHAEITKEDNVTALVEAGLDEETAENYLAIMFHLGASIEPTLSN